MACVGRGPDRQHCCQVNGEDCEVLVYVNGQPRCPFISKGEPMLDNPKWEQLPVGRHFAKAMPGFDCRDFPQNIPAIMNNQAAGKCCWERAG